ncbi:binding-protein-dependent transport systems inner membrane component [Beutenbergia cavernae DSM 12333]|uniref:Binding-protein-dependent transport systems inner membrane component n=1 Tax=Beutenbergia cavernae (strain ATCC BAA-8 / DSM 12333 / CCUG 43141 / JCM 11478 / NBRC 16432 / NCIMB 13614 / HKI 0122) TaxID=471853 RepID=C5BZR6_BEUC1|nr:carbohydrate ABC transporter permease [Beutenbergia cavernae]ACQ81246.1 binding-protein-dependent transport systems inner membrane component [Beutenbergia cavernae DSM 12333]
MALQSTQATRQLTGDVLADAPPPDRRGRRADGSRQKWYSSVTSRIVLIALSLLFLTPLYWMVASALKSNEELAIYPPTLWPSSPMWENFSQAIAAMPFWLFFRNTTVITVSSVILAVIANFVVAYGFGCIEWRGRDKVFYIVIATLFLPFPITLIPMFDLWANLGWVNTWLPLIVPNMFASAFFTFLLRQFLLQVPQDMLNAARVDGASEWRIAWRIVFPSARPALTAVAIFSAVGAWNDFMGPLIYLQETNVQTLSIGMQVFRMTNAQDISFNLLMAASFLVILPLIVLFFVFQRYFISGITIGGFK